MATPAHQPTPLPGSPGAVLASARAAKAAELAAAAQILIDAAEWASMHEPVDAADESAWHDHSDPIEIAGEGAPPVSEFAVAEFAAAIGLTTDAGRALMGQALELAHRLPKVWRQVKTGTIPAWRARKLAAQTTVLPPEAAEFVDKHVAAVAGKVSHAQLQRLITEAERRWTPDRAEWPDDPNSKRDKRRVIIDTDQVDLDGVVHLEANIDFGDALDLDQALKAIAQQLKLAGSGDGLDVRRAAALGEIARHQLAFGIEGSGDRSMHEEPMQLASGNHRRAGQKQYGRPVTLYLHLSEDSVTGVPGHDVGRCENARAPIDVEVIRTWCGNPDVQLTIKQVIDLNEHVAVPQYEVPVRIQERTDLRDTQCVFPWCTRPARTACDHDHAIPRAMGGSTCTCNIAALCRHHHRLKTHTAWRYKMPEPGVYIWTSPHGYVFLRDHTGTVDVTPAGLVPIPGCPTGMGDGPGADPPDR